MPQLQKALKVIEECELIKKHNAKVILDKGITKEDMLHSKFIKPFGYTQYANALKTVEQTKEMLCK